MLDTNGRVEFLPRNIGEICRERMQEDIYFHGTQLPRGREEDGRGETSGLEALGAQLFRAWLPLWLTGAQQRERQHDVKWDEGTFTYS